MASNDYVVGAMVLGYSLRRSGWDRETIVQVTSEISRQNREQLSLMWGRVIEVQPIVTPHRNHELGLPAHVPCYTKLRMWELTEFNRLIFIDADALVLGSLTELMEGADFAAAPCVTAPDLFNSGVMAITPSQSCFEDMMSQVGILPSYDGGDQGFLNSYFPDWFTGDPSRRLPMKFNTPRTHYLYRPSWDRFSHDMRILHFFGPTKPWNFGATFSAWMLRQLTPSTGDGVSTLGIWKQLFREMHQERKASQMVATPK